jgi:ribonucleoside-diphosphate reductase alpha chain
MERVKLPKTRKSVTHKVIIGISEFYIIVGLYENGKPGEVFAKEKNNDTPILDQWCRAVSIMLQDGHTTAELVKWFGHARYQPSGMTDNPKIHSAHSITDYVVRWMDINFGGKVS